MSRSNTTWSPSKENLLVQNLKKLEQSPVSDERAKMYGSHCSLNLENNFIDLPTEPKRRRIMAEESPCSMGSQVSSQMSSRSHSPTPSETFLDDSFMSTPSLMSTPSASPSGTMKEHFRRKYRKDELWAAIETNYKYLMDKGIIEACQVRLFMSLLFVDMQLFSKGQNLGLSQTERNCNQQVINKKSGNGFYFR